MKEAIRKQTHTRRHFLPPMMTLDHWRTLALPKNGHQNYTEEWALPEVSGH